MIRFILAKLLGVVLVMFIVATVVFVISHIIPGDPAAVMLGAAATAEDVERLRKAFGLDAPLLTQYAGWLWQLLQFDLGQSIFLGQSVGAAMLQRAELTLTLCIFATTLAAAIGIPLGILAAVRRGQPIDQASTALALLGASLPSFWLGLLLIQYLGVKAGWFPVSGYGPPGASFPERAYHLILPAIALALPNAVLILRITRTTMLDVLSQDYIRTAEAKGLGRASVILKHALRNALIQILTIVGLTATIMIGGTVVTETVFGLPGVGYLIVNAVLRRDYPVIQGVLMVVSGIYVLINLVIDLLYVAIDPRLRRKVA